MEEFESYETIQLTYHCKECDHVWTEFNEFICDSECDHCGQEKVKAIKVKEML